MNPIMKLGAKLAALLAAFPLVLAVSMSCFPMWLLDDEYAYYRQNKEYGQGHDGYCRVLILGDSSVKAALHPDLLSDDTYNFALGGASPIEEYYCLREYLEHNEAPEYVLCTFYLLSMTQARNFWKRFVYFHRMDDDVLADIREQLAAFNDISSLGVSDVGEFTKEAWIYRMYAPQKYNDALLKGLWENACGGKRYKTNIKNYQEAVENKGHFFCGTKEYCDDEDSKLASMEEFYADEVIDHYFRSLIVLCEENGIQFVFQSPPYNTSTHIKKTVVDGYTAYLESIQQDYPNAVIDETLCWYGPEYFGGATHVNQNGMERYSLETVQQYPEIFQG